MLFGFFKWLNSLESSQISRRLKEEFPYVTKEYSFGNTDDALEVLKDK